LQHSHPKIGYEARVARVSFWIPGLRAAHGCVIRKAYAAGESKALRHRLR
jgi:hypothetical protein